MPNKRPLSNVPALAIYMNTGERHVRNLVARRAIPFVKVGALLRFDLDEIDAWLGEHSTPAV